jgi:hypothetical protein
MSIAPLLILVSEGIMINFIQFAIPFTLALLYPILRLLGTLFDYS